MRSNPSFKPTRYGRQRRLIGLRDDPVADPLLPRLGIDARHIARGGVDVDARDLHLGLPPVGQVLAAHERGVQAPEREEVGFAQGGGGLCISGDENRLANKFPEARSCSVDALC